MYIIQEIQTNNGVTALLPAIQKETLREAESTFYTICGSAVISNVEEHTVMVYTHTGAIVRPLVKCFVHRSEQ